ncbi:hypothetical protein D1609_04290 [Leptospira borgpetersenii serovar Hardjo-bovis]|nr:hypothetical protein B9T54_04320 [Leptospira borgpetersenii serovar Hardjo-bovis]AYR07861.1 hypothetical protein D1609_04290 [Leptospira borgpetersenii serovar Hardjo-bovis]TQE53300.1 hypothetical protein FFZ95_07785 [Leptospira borgpetersenii]TQE57226.1 hypothetical protein FFZ96_07480 [Leptospira borgpetersenii]
MTKNEDKIAFRGLRTDELRFARSRQRTETGELLHRGFRMRFTETKKRTKAYRPQSSERVLLRIC